MININIPTIPGFRFLELFMFLGLCTFGITVSNAQSNNELQLKISSQATVLSEGDELVVYISNLDSISYNTILWTVPADWLVNGEYTHGIDFENDTMVIVTVGASSGSIAAHVFKHNAANSIQVAANFTVVPSYLFQYETQVEFVDDEETPLLFSSSLTYLVPVQVGGIEKTLSK